MTISNMIGQSLGRYHILEQLGEGGMAKVYKAYDTRLETDVALKIIRTERFTSETLERALKRFEREAKALAKLMHPNIVKVTDYGVQDGKPYLVMPYLPGGTLKELLKERGKMNWREAVSLILPVARALEYAHQQNIIHRDVKPSNILITAAGDPVLADFGVAKVLEEEATVELTGTGVGIGTPEYMAPEQVTARNVDGRVDIYALGIVLYEMVTGRKPYKADTPMAVMIMHARDPLPSPSQYTAELPEGVEKVLYKALAKNPEDRYSNAGELVKALQGLLDTGGSISKGQKDIPVHPTRKWMWVGGAVVVLMAALVVGTKLINPGGFSLGKTPTPVSTATKMVILTDTLQPSLTSMLTPSPTVTKAPTPEPPMYWAGEWTLFLQNEEDVSPRQFKTIDFDQNGYFLSAKFDNGFNNSPVFFIISGMITNDGMTFQGILTELINLNKYNYNGEYCDIVLKKDISYPGELQGHISCNNILGSFKYSTGSLEYKSRTYIDQAKFICGSRDFSIPDVCYDN